MRYEIPFIRPVFPPGEVVAADVAEIVEANWFTNFGPKETRFRASIAEYLGGGLDVATFSNATLALVGALSVLIGDRAVGGFVIVPSFTFAAGPQAIRWVGASPLFIDIDERSLQPSFSEAENACDSLGERVVGILLCNTFGIGGAEVAAWEALAARCGIPLIIDSAAGFGSCYPDGTKVGTRGDCEVFSFHATKPFAIGEGGAVVARDPAVAAALRSFSNFGFDGPSGSARPGLNGKLQEVNAAIGLRQLETIDAVVRERQLLLESYRDLFEGSGWGRLAPNAEASSVCFASVVLTEDIRRDAFITALQTRGIEARVYYAPPVHAQPAFAGERAVGALPATNRVGRGILALPVFQGLPAFVFDIVRAVVKGQTGRGHADD